MSSTYTNLGIQKMATGEKAGTWGTLTNTNWNIIEQISGGYTTQALTDNGTKALVKNDGTTGATLATRIIKLTGTLSAGNSVVTVPDSIENWWLVNNAEGGSTYTVTFKTVSGSGVSWAAGVTGTKLLYTDGTNVLDASADFGSVAGSTTQVQYNNSGAFAGDANLTWVAADGLNIGSQKALRLQDTSGGQYIGMKAAGTTTSYTLTMPGAVATAAGQALKSTTGGVLSWGTGGAITLTLPGSPALGDQVSFIDYGSAATNNITIARNGKTIQGAAADLTIALDRAASTLVYDGSAGWLLTDN